MALNITTDRPSGTDISERGRSPEGHPISLDQRLFMQLLVFRKCRDTQPLIEMLGNHHVHGVLYANLNDPFGVGLLTLSQDPDYFVTHLRRLLQQEPFASLVLQPSYTMFGRTYTIGYESDLEEVLLRRPHRYVCTPAWSWSIWYPLRRAGAFEQLSPKEQRTMLMEHGGIGRSYGRADHAHDIRLACHGFDASDNDFVVGLLGKDLYPLSAIIQRMRKTRQTSQYLSQIGPFFTGKALWQSAIPSS